MPIALTSPQAKPHHRSPPIPRDVTTIHKLFTTIKKKGKMCTRLKVKINKNKKNVKKCQPWW